MGRLPGLCRQVTHLTDFFGFFCVFFFFFFFANFFFLGRMRVILLCIATILADGKSPSYELKELDDQTKEDLKKLNYLKELDYPNDEQDELWKKHTDNVRMSDMGYDDKKQPAKLGKPAMVVKLPAEVDRKIRKIEYRLDAMANQLDSLELAFRSIMKPVPGEKPEENPEE